MFDVIIVGGSSAGLSAALTLGRSRRKVLIFDDAQPCNRFSKASHGFLTRDGIAPDKLLEIAREQLSPYKSIELRSETVIDITPESYGFRVQTDSGSQYSARKLLLATGIKDELPAIKGLANFWGRSVFHCPYCDGWEVRDEPLVVIGGAQTAFHQTMLLWNWTSNLTLCTHAEWEVSDEQRALLKKNNIHLVETAISHVEGADGQIRQIVFEDGTVLTCKAIFTHPALHHRTPFATALGCKINEQNRVEIDLLGHTTVAGVYAAGDLTSPMRSISMAVAQGAMAGAGINYDLIVEDFYA